MAGSSAASAVAPPTLASGLEASCGTAGASSVSAVLFSDASVDFLPLSCETLVGVFAFGLCGDGTDGAALSVDVRLGTSKLWRGLAVGVGFAEDPSPFAAFAATALASLSCSRSFCLVLVESDIDGPGVLDCCEGVGLGVGLGVSSSARMVSSRASTPATACERREPHFGLNP